MPFSSGMLSDSGVESEVRNSISLCLSSMISTPEFWQTCVSIPNKSTGIIVSKSGCLRYLFLYNVRFSKIDFTFEIFIILIILIIFLASETDSASFFSLCNIYNKSLSNLTFLETIIYSNWDIQILYILKTIYPTRYLIYILNLILYALFSIAFLQFFLNKYALEL